MTDTTTHPGATLERLGPDAIRSLADGLRGDLVTPDDDSYDEARRVWNGLVNEYPALIARCAGVADVMTAVEFAREHDIRLSIKSGGHHETGSAIVQSGLVIDLGEMNSVQVDPVERTARVEPGVSAGDLHHETQQFGLAAPTGSADDIGIGGSTLSGGLGWLRRKHGLGIDALRSIDVVTAEGDLRRASRERNEDLFWGLRGAGGNFGVATAFEFDLYPVGPEVMALGVFYPAEEGRTVLRGFHEFVTDAPEELSALVLSGHVPSLPMIPPEVQGREAIGLMGCYAGSIDEGEAVVAHLRELADSLVDLSGPMPFLALHELGSAMFPDGRNYCWRSAFVEELTEDLQEAVLEYGERAPSELCSVSVWPIDGRVQDVATDSTAFPWRDSNYMLTVEANWEGTDSTTYIEWARETDATFRELGATGAYAGFPGLDGGDEDLARMVYGENYERIAALKSEYDPSNLFRETSNVPPADDQV